MPEKMSDNLAVSISVNGAGGGGGCVFPFRCASSAAMDGEWRCKSEAVSLADESVSSSSIVNLGAIDATVTRRVESCDEEEDDEEASKSVDS